MIGEFIGASTGSAFMIAKVMNQNYNQKTITMSCFIDLEYHNIRLILTK